MSEFKHLCYINSEAWLSSELSWLTEGMHPVENMSENMFEPNQNKAQKKQVVVKKSLLFSVVILFLTPINHAFSQSLKTISESLNQVVVSHIISNVTITPVLDESEEVFNLNEGDFLALGDVVRTGEDSMLRMYFPDGTTETLCENMTYRVLERGGEVYEDDDADQLENVISAFNRCNIRPRFIERCRDENGFITRYSKAGERGKVGGLDLIESQTTVDQNINNTIEEELGSLINRNDYDFDEADYSLRCTTGERLFTEYIFIQNPVEIQTVFVPRPAETPVTLPETGGSPVN